MKKIYVIVWVLSLLLILAVGYILISVYQNVKAQKDQTLFIEGAQQGFTTAIGQIFQVAATCQQVPLTYQNATINLIAVECLQQPAAGS